MINQLLLICSTIIIYEFIRYFELKKIIKSNIVIYNKIFNLFRLKKVSDYRKEKLILHYSKSLFIVSIKIITLIISIFMFIYAINFLSNSFINLIISVYGFVEITLVILIYHLVKKKIYAKL